MDLRTLWNPEMQNQSLIRNVEKFDENVFYSWISFFKQCCYNCICCLHFLKTYYPLAIDLLILNPNVQIAAIRISESYKSFLKLSRCNTCTLQVVKMIFFDCK